MNQNKKPFYIKCTRWELAMLTVLLLNVFILYCRPMQISSFLSLKGGTFVACDTGCCAAISCCWNIEQFSLSMCVVLIPTSNMLFLVRVVGHMRFMIVMHENAQNQKPANHQTFLFLKVNSKFLRLFQCFSSLTVFDKVLNSQTISRNILTASKTMELILQVTKLGF